MAYEPINFSQDLLDLLAKDTQSVTMKDLVVLDKEIDKFLTQFIDFRGITDARLKQVISAYETIPDESKTTLTYQILKAFNTKATVLQTLLRDGLLLTEKVRQFFTGEQIIYKIGIQKGTKQASLEEYSLRIEDLLQHTLLGRAGSKQASSFQTFFRLTLRNNKTNIRNDISVLERQLDAAIDDGSTVWSKVWNFVHNQSKKGNKYNWGHAYQAYNLIVQQRNGNNRVPPTIRSNTIRNAIMRVRSNTASGFLGGDFYNQQLKFLGEHSAGITNLYTIDQSLQSVSKAIKDLTKSGNIQLFRQTLQETFIKQNKDLMSKKLEAASRDAALDYLDSMMDTLQAEIKI